jgi:nucleoid DNA-binding protein
MNELIEKMTADAGITPEQAQKALESVADYVKEKFPMIGGAVDQMFGTTSDEE